MLVNGRLPILGQTPAMAVLNHAGDPPDLFGYVGSCTAADAPDWRNPLPEDAVLDLEGALLLPGAQSANLCLYLPLSPGRLLAACAAVYALLRGVVYCFGRAQGRSFAAVLVCGSARVPVQAFCDTGFAVQDPLSGRAVALAYYPAVRGALPGALQAFLDAHFAGRSPLPPPGLGVRLVPCTTLAGPCLLPAVPGLRLQAGQRQAQGFLTAFYCPAAPPDHWTLLLGPELAGTLSVKP